jgi:hypothetical protein
MTATAASILIPQPASRPMGQHDHAVNGRLTCRLLDGRRLQAVTIV